MCGILYNTVPYYFLKNLQGDIIAVTNANGETVAKYSYDAWGVCTVTEDDSGIGTVNPYRYRGYYYDAEIGLYYLQSRYYDAGVGRLVNADEAVFATISRENAKCALYTYSDNEPVLNSDYTGYWVVSVGVSNGFAAGLGLNFFANFLLDSTGAFGLLIGATLLFGVSFGAFGKPSKSFSIGVFWGFKKIANYLEAITVSFAVIGGALVYSYYKYPLNNKKLVGIQIFSKGTNIFRETAPIDGGIYIPLKNFLSNLVKNCGPIPSN